MFGIFKKPRKPTNTPDFFSDLRPSSKAQGFMVSMLNQLARTNRTYLRVRRSEGLPAVASIHGDALEADYSGVANCLKVSSMLNPISYDHPIEGGFEFFCPDSDGAIVSFIVGTHFDDREPDPYFEITISKKTT
jgi:hypothetical protein